MNRTTAIAIVLLFTISQAFADPPETTHISDVIYGRSYTTALTLDVFTPVHNPKNIGVIVVVSGGWVSSTDIMNKPIARTFLDPLTSRGFTVFAVTHGSQPKYTIPEILPQISRAVRFIRYHAKDYHIDPNRLGIVGGSAGGHLSLMQAYDPVPPDMKSPDPIDHEPATVQAVAAFFPPTDFVNYGSPGILAWKSNLVWLPAPFDFRDFDAKAQVFVQVTDEVKRIEIGKTISPITYVKPGLPPTLIIHGTVDKLVPFQQALVLMAKLKEAKNDATLITKPGKDHGWPDIADDVKAVSDFFTAQIATTQPTR